MTCLLIDRISITFADAKLCFIMEINKIYPPYIYSVKYDEETENEFDRLFDSWSDVEKILSFFESHKEYLKDDTWKKVSDPEQAASQVLHEARKLEDLFDELNENTKNGKEPDFDAHFKYLNGSKYQCEMEYIPMKSYGTYNPSFLRIYAIKLARNTYVITGGGIKLAHSIQDSPQIKEHVFRHIDIVRKWLKDNGIFDSEDL